MSFRTLLRLFAHTQLTPALESGEETLIGGQAVIEGVMMRAPHSYCVAVRRPNGEIVSEEHPLPKPSEKYPILRFPVLRGLGTLGQALSLGIKALRFSANASISEVDARGARKELPGWLLAANLIFSLGFFIFLYKFMPLWFTTELKAYLPVVNNHFVFNVVDGIVRIAFFLGFLLAAELHRHQVAGDFIAYGLEHDRKQLEGFALVFLLGVLLGVAPQVDALAQVVQRR